MDVVPAGDGWSADPYTMRERDGWIIGRGVLDDKGPSIICLYALKYLKEKNVPLRYGVRALLGSNEETHMDDVEYYLKNYPAPAFCFSPDADFPVCNGEKGIFQGELVSKCPLDTIISINGGFAVNAVPDKATAVLKCSGKLPESTESVSVSAADGKITLNEDSSWMFAYFTNLKDYTLHYTVTANDRVIRSGKTILTVEPQQSQTYTVNVEGLKPQADTEYFVNFRVTNNVASALVPAGYEVIFLGFPVWWYSIPAIIRSFVEAYDFSGKVIVPFATSGSSGMGRSSRDIQRLCPGAKVQPGKLLNGSHTDEELLAWMDKY